MGESVALKKSVTIPADLLEQVAGLNPAGNLSAYVTEALRAKVEQDNLAQLLDELRAEHGPEDPADVARWNQILA
ncbi:MAG: hypothetical protein FWE61_03530 [Micrococcales bacterium]|nr:hypothetical protein [Micrococcales bacterium]